MWAQLWISEGGHYLAVAADRQSEMLPVQALLPQILPVPGLSLTWLYLLSLACDAPILSENV